MSNEVVVRTESNTAHCLIAIFMDEIAIDLIREHIQKVVARADKHDGRFPFAIDGDTRNEGVFCG